MPQSMAVVNKTKKKQVGIFVSGAAGSIELKQLMSLVSGMYSPNPRCVFKLFKSTPLVQGLRSATYIASLQLASKKFNPPWTS